MTYRGKVKPGSPDVRELPHLHITKASVGPMDNNAYLLQCRATDELALIDAAAEADTLLGLLGGQPLARIVTTHRHQDHWSALPEVLAATDAETIAGVDDVDGIPVRTSRPVRDGDSVEIGESSFTVIHLVGHTPGSIALLYDDPEGT
ncbi:MAG: MBL fold metallo-hydrolase, partial [Actinomycetota bacterium]|nr:MBL fold metallo-hydrolase [Actinomycetota bacterium]